METAGQITRRRTTFRLRQDLLERLKEIDLEHFDAFVASLE